MKNLTTGWTLSLTIFFWTWSLTFLKTLTKQVRSSLQFSLVLSLNICCKGMKKVRFLKVNDEVCGLKHLMVSTFLSSSDRHRCATWIKKLCDPATCGTSLSGRKNRNMYARLLLHMLKRGLLELPFTVKPGPGPLKTLPTYMVRHS